MSTNPANITISQAPPIKTTCPECSGNMKQGYSVVSPFPGVAFSWIAGAPTKTFFGGLVVPWHKRVPIAHFRCESCGYLKSYARKEFEPK